MVSEGHLSKILKDGSECWDHLATENLAKLNNS